MVSDEVSGPKNGPAGFVLQGIPCCGSSTRCVNSFYVRVFHKNRPRHPLPLIGKNLTGTHFPIGYNLSTRYNYPMLNQNQKSLINLLHVLHALHVITLDDYLAILVHHNYFSYT